MIKNKIAVIGAAGYVGTPVTLNFARAFDVVGFDIDLDKICALEKGEDPNKEHTKEAIEKNIDRIMFTVLEQNLEDVEIFVICVPTPIDESKSPDLTMMKEACKTVGKYLMYGSIVVIESTVYPGCIEEEIVPVLEQYSHMTLGDFSVGHSPERINPGDTEHTIRSMPKLIAASDTRAIDRLHEVYRLVIDGDIMLMQSIKACEAVKVFENSHRDINISFVNECSIVFNYLGIDFSQVLAGASTKWNFLNFTPGLVGGHCIGVDPYYLTHVAKRVGIEPQVIAAGRRVNNFMPQYVAIELMRAMRLELQEKRVLMLGCSYKANVADVRNSGALKLADALMTLGVRVDIIDPIANRGEVEDLGFELADEFSPYYSAIVIAVPHGLFKAMTIDDLQKRGAYILFDLYGIHDHFKDHFNHYFKL